MPRSGLVIGDTVAVGNHEHDERRDHLASI
jgi:hypothetical protein